MADAFRPLTLLLGAVCLWALCVLVLALGGLGRRFADAEAAASPPPIPVVSLTRSESRLGLLTQYLVVGQRPLFNQNRQPSLQVADNGQGSAELDVMLTSVLITPHLQLAILTGNKDGSVRRVRVGENIEGSSWRLVQLEPRRATVEGPSGQRVLDLRVFDGRGGELPTPSTTGVANTPAAPRDMTVKNVPPPEPVVSAENTDPGPVSPSPNDSQAAQQQQIESIRRRIEARRAQMRAEAEAAGANEK